MSTTTSAVLPAGMYWWAKSVGRRLRMRLLTQSGMAYCCMGRIVHNPCTYVDLYCERLAPGLFGEPLNTLSNAAFLFAAWLLVRDARRLGAWRPDTALLVALVVA